MQQLERELAVAQSKERETMKRLCDCDHELNQLKTKLEAGTLLEWIPVGDMLPDEGVNVLAMYQGAVIGIEGWRKEWMNNYALTHWCPWPTAPKL